MLTGHFTCEPVAGELVRQALAIGFNLMPYEDSIEGHSIQQREYAQAEHIYNLFKKDPKAKVILIGGAEHIEKAAASKDRIPMAASFKILSGIDPLTIDQTTMTEGSINSYGNYLYDQFCKSHAFNSPVVAMVSGKSRDPFGLNLNDLYIFHPPTRYKNGRPVWLAMNGFRKETGVQPAYQNLFFCRPIMIRSIRKNFWDR